jgi:hypothetical protein
VERLKPIYLHQKERRVARAARTVRLYGELDLDEDDDADRVDITVRVRPNNFLSLGGRLYHELVPDYWFVGASGTAAAASPLAGGE